MYIMRGNDGCNSFFMKQNKYTLCAQMMFMYPDFVGCVSFVTILCYFDPFILGCHKSTVLIVLDY